MPEVVAEPKGEESADEARQHGESDNILRCGQVPQEAGETDNEQPEDETTTEANLLLEWIWCLQAWRRLTNNRDFPVPETATRCQD